MPEQRTIKPLPAATNTEMAAAVTMVGGVLLNVILYHLIHFPEAARQDQATKTFDIVRTAISGFSFSRGSPEEWANTRKLIALVEDVEANVRDELLNRRDGDLGVKH